MNRSESSTNPDRSEKPDSATFKPSRKAMTVFWILVMALLCLYILVLHGAVR